MSFEHTYRSMILCTSLSGILCILAFPPCGFSWLAWISLVPFFYSLSQQKNFRQLFLSHFIFLSIFFGIGVFWMAQVHPICPFVLVIPLFFMCLPFPILFRLTLQYKILSIFWSAPILWVTQEYVRGWLFSGFPYLFLGHSQALDFPTIIQIADITGVYGVSFIIILTNACLTYWLKYAKEKYTISQKEKTSSDISLSTMLKYSIITILFISISFGYGKYRLSSISYQNGPIIASIQGNIPQDIKDDPTTNIRHILEAYCQNTILALQQSKPDMIIWPETMMPDDIFNNPQSFLLSQDIAKKNKVHFLVGSHYYNSDFSKKESRIRNSAFFLNPEGKCLERYDKIHLVVIGEFVPLRNIFPFIPIIIRNLVGFVPDLEAGECRPVFSLKDFLFGCMICFDIAYSEDVRILRQQGCQFLVNMTNEGWFMHTAELEQLLQISIFRAVENRMGVLRSGNTGITLNIPPTGILNYDDILSMPLENYWKSLPGFLQKRWIHSKKIAWQHIPEFLWRKDSPLFASFSESWDFIYKDRPMKWKDFSGAFCRPVPLSTKEMPFYTKYGNVFIWILCAISIFITIKIMLHQKS